jgi:hypothetical protein
MATSNQHIFGIDGRPILCVPESEMDLLLLRYADESTHLVPGSGHTPGFSVWFSPDAVRSVIPGYVIRLGFEGYRYVNALSGTVSFLGLEDSKRFN